MMIVGGNRDKSHNASRSNVLSFDRSQIIFSASKGETGNQVGSNDADISIIETKREGNQDMALSDIDLSEAFMKP